MNDRPDELGLTVSSTISRRGPRGTRREERKKIVGGKGKGKKKKRRETQTVGARTRYLPLVLRHQGTERRKTGNFGQGRVGLAPA